MTVKSVACSFFSCAGNIAESAMAAEAPHMAVAPPDKKPNNGLNPIARARTTETPMVMATIAMTMKTGVQPNAMI